jgi:uncharacterized OsmC-like protein
LPSLNSGPATHGWKERTTEIRVFFKIEADLSEREKQELIEMGKKYSPVYNTLTKSVPANVKLDK